MKASVLPRSGGVRAYAIRCHACRTLAEYPSYRCQACDGPLVAELEPTGASLASTGSGFWRRGSFLPASGHAVTLGEGGTPMLRVDPPSEHPGFTVFAKLESLNPTLSFKDRAMALGASIALDLGMRGLVLASTGNAAVSAAAYAAAAGLECQVYAGLTSGAEDKLALAAAYGASVRMVDGDYSAACAEATRLEGPEWLNVSTTHRNPLLAEAHRTIAPETLEQLGRTPDVVVVPVGAGPLLVGIAHGFEDLVDSGAISRVPRLVAMQAEACAPLARAWESSDWRASLEAPLRARETIAEAIADPLRGYEREGLITLEAVRATGGAVVRVGDPAMRHYQSWLATQRGILVEPASAGAIAVAFDQSLLGELPDDAVVLALLTGHGSKDQVARETSPGRSENG